MSCVRGISLSIPAFSTFDPLIFLSSLLCDEDLHNLHLKGSRYEKICNVADLFFNLLPLEGIFFFTDKKVIVFQFAQSCLVMTGLSRFSKSLQRDPRRATQYRLWCAFLLEFQSRLSFATFRLNLDECSAQSVSIALGSTAFCFRRSYLVGWSVSAVIIIHGNRFQPRWA
jgi:hypothetical protein